MEAIVGFVGVIVGFILNELAQWWRSRKVEKQQKAAIRTLLRLEIDRNLAAVQDFWNTASSPPVEETNQNPDDLRVFLAMQLADTPLPDWNRKAFESQLTVLPTALKEEEIRQIYYLQSRLEAITSIYNKLLKVRTERREDVRAISELTTTPERIIANKQIEIFKKNLLKQFEAFEQVTNAVLSDGNPLRDKPEVGQSEKSQLARVKQS